MPQKTFYHLWDSANPAMQDGGTPPADAADDATGWTPGNSSGNAALNTSSFGALDNTRARNSFGADSASVPDVPGSPASNYIRSPTPLTGSFASAAWSLSFRLVNTVATWNGQGRVKYRVWRSANADGSGATEITSGAQVTGATSGAWGVNVSKVVTGTFTPAAFSVSGEYIFITWAFQITTAGTGSTNSRQIMVGVGSAANLITSDLVVPAVNLAFSISPTSTYSAALRAERRLSLSSAGVSIAQSPLRVERRISPLLSAASTAEAALVVERYIASLVSGQGNVQGAIGVERLLGMDAPGVSALALDLGVERRVEFSSAAESMLDAPLTVERLLGMDASSASGAAFAIEIGDSQAAVELAFAVAAESAFSASPVVERHLGMVAEGASEALFAIDTEGAVLLSFAVLGVSSFAASPRVERRLGMAVASHLAFSTAFGGILAPYVLVAASKMSLVYEALGREEEAMRAFGIAVAALKVLETEAESVETTSGEAEAPLVASGASLG